MDRVKKGVSVWVLCALLTGRARKVERAIRTHGLVTARNFTPLPSPR
jgi:hypothetical protein